MTPDWNILTDAFKFAPGVIALLLVIYLMYKLLLKKEESVQKILEISKADQKRNEKILTLLEVLTNKGA